MEDSGRDIVIDIRVSIPLDGCSHHHVSERGNAIAVKYRDKVLGSMFAFSVGPDFVLMDDNVKPHRANLIEEFLEIRIFAGLIDQPDLQTTSP
ncbi:hypothetical protein TNCV_691031 [Trichonephila clavipes]|nr:hypothetical protein TNCV_691031 [Trichonephila clavipes]